MAKKPLDFEHPLKLTRTPAGIEIGYFMEPRRAYAIRQGDGVPPEEWVEVPSVTTILDVLPKPGLSWWGMRVGAAGVVALIEKGLAAMSTDGKLAVNAAGTWVYANVPLHELGNVEALLKDHKLTVNDTLEEASDRGQSVHDAFEAWAGFGIMPDPMKFPPEARMYAEGLRKFCVDMDDAWETEGQEIAVASMEHRFAGRYDLRGKITKDVKLVTRATTLKGEPLKRDSDRKYVIIPEGTKLLNDLKTSKGIYAAHLIQLEAYEGAGVEGGLEPTDARAVLHVTKDGLYEFKRARATYDDFLAILHTWHTLNGVEEALKA